MLQDETVDAVYIATPPFVHAQQIKQCLNAGKHVLCESPFALKGSECIELEQLALNNNLVLMDSIKTAYSTAYSRLLLLLKGGNVGEVYSIDAYIYFDILLGNSNGERFAYFEIKERNSTTVKYSKYVYKNPITNQVISDIIFIPAGHTLTIKAISSEVFTSAPTGNIILVK